MKVEIPVPRVPGPPISAPPASRDWNSIVPAPPGIAPPEPIYGKALDQVGGLPKPVANAIWGAVKLVNKSLFRSDPANPPVPETEGSWKFAALGDYGSGHAPQDEIAQNIAKGKPSLILTLGDNVYYNGTEQEFRDKWDGEDQFLDLLLADESVGECLTEDALKNIFNYRHYIERTADVIDRVLNAA